MTVYIIRAFVKMREDLAANAAILRRLAEIDKTLLIHDAALREMLQKLRPLPEPPPVPQNPKSASTPKKTPSPTAPSEKRVHNSSFIAHPFIAALRFLFSAFALTNY